MWPKWHILYGFLFTLLLWMIFPDISYFYIIITFLSSFLIDVDHYLYFVIKTKNFSFSKSLEYHRLKEIEEVQNYKKGIRKKMGFHPFHTIEFHIIIGLFSLVWKPFLFVFIGILFHSLIDFCDMFSRDRIYTREYFFVNWLKKLLTKSKQN